MDTVMNKHPKRNILLAITLFALSLTIHTSPLIDNAYLPSIQGQLAPASGQKNLGRSHITYLEDDAGQKFVLKCRYNPDDDQPIRDALGAYIGNSVDARFNQVQIISPDTQLPGKNTDYAASLHTCMPGKELSKIANLAQQLYIGNLHLEHSDMQKIRAVDIFLNNSDRHPGNIIYDEQTNHYYAIDMDYIYPDTKKCSFFDYALNAFQDKNNYLANKVAHKIAALMDNPAVSKEKKRQALTQFYQTLKQLVDTYPPSKLYNLWLSFAQQAQYTYTLRQKAMIRIDIAQNYTSVKNLLTKIEKMLSHNP